MSDFLLRKALLNTALVSELNMRDMQQLISQARSARLLASLASQLQQSERLQFLPFEVRRHFESALLIHEKQARDISYECQHLGATLAGSGEKLILLKGAAYILGRLPVGQGRLVTDIDILIPHDSIGRIESAFNDTGWESSYVDSYNEQYYRRWSHEIPPMTHVKRGTTLDVHHNILPPTAAPNINPELLFADAVEIDNGVFTLSRLDMLIHSATHLFHEGEFHHGLRDLWDLDRMLRDFPTRESDFWKNLVARASALDLVGPLFHALNYSQRIFETPIPAHVLPSVASKAALARKPLMDFLFSRAFRPDHRQCKLPYTDLALYALYVRSHYLRMPMHLLLPHLARKAWMNHFEEKNGVPVQEANQ